MSMFYHTTFMTDLYASAGSTFEGGYLVIVLFSIMCQQFAQVPNINYAISRRLTKRLVCDSPSLYLWGASFAIGD